LQGLRAVLSNRQGLFVVLALPVGNYTVKVSHVSFKPQTFEEVRDRKFDALIITGALMANGSMHPVWGPVAAWFGIMGGDMILYQKSVDPQTGAVRKIPFLLPIHSLYSNVAAAFKQHHRVGFKNTTQPGYSVERYVQCLKKAQEEIRAYGYDRFRLLEPQTPLARLFDKVAFIVGRDLQRSSE